MHPHDAGAHCGARAHGARACAAAPVCSSGFARWLTARCGPQVVVWTRHGRRFTLKVKANATVAQLKAHIAACTGTCTRLQRLALSRLLMEDGRTLASYGIHDGASVQLLLRVALRPPPARGVDVGVDVAGAPHTSATLLAGEETPAARASLKLHEPFRKAREALFTPCLACCLSLRHASRRLRRTQRRTCRAMTWRSTSCIWWGPTAASAACLPRSARRNRCGASSRSRALLHCTACMLCTAC